MGEISSVSRACVCLPKIMQLSRFVNENRKKNRQNAFLLFTPKKETRIILNARRVTRKRFEGTTRPFRSEFIGPCVARVSKISQKLFRIQKIGELFQYKFTIKAAIFLAVEFPEVLKNFAESPWPEK